RAVRDSRHTHHSTRDLVERATFSSNPMTSAERLGAGLTPWGAVQEAAWAARKDDPGSAHAAGRPHSGTAGSAIKAESPKRAAPLMTLWAVRGLKDRGRVA